MARKRHTDEEMLRVLREFEVHPASGSDVATAYRAGGISDATCYRFARWAARAFGSTSSMPWHTLVDHRQEC